MSKVCQHTKELYAIENRDIRADNRPAIAVFNLLDRKLVKDIEKPSAPIQEVFDKYINGRESKEWPKNVTELDDALKAKKLEPTKEETIVRMTVEEPAKNSKKRRRRNMSQAFQDSRNANGAQSVV